MISQIKDVLTTLWISCKQFLAGNEILVSPEIENIRINECLNCVYITGNTPKTYRCKLCKCFIQLKIKTVASKCPINRW